MPPTTEEYDLYAYALCRLCHFRDWRMHTGRILVAMDDRRYRYKLLIPLMERDYGKTAEEILDTCRAVAEFAEESTADQIKELQQRVNINHQVWSRLIILSKDQRLLLHSKNLPPSYSALYAVSRMTDQEIAEAIESQVISVTASSHAILEWTKLYRSYSREDARVYRSVLVFDSDLSIDQQLLLRVDLEDLASRHGGKFYEAWNYIPSRNLQEPRQAMKREEIRLRLQDVLIPLFNTFTEYERNRYGLATVSDLIDYPLRGYLRTIAVVSDRLGRNDAEGEDYALKLCYEYFRSETKSKRYQIKKRLVDLGSKRPELKAFVDGIYAEFLEN